MEINLYKLLVHVKFKRIVIVQTRSPPWRFPLTSNPDNEGT
jgi:hypothetical protein